MACVVKNIILKLKYFLKRCSLLPFSSSIWGKTRMQVKNDLRCLRQITPIFSTLTRIFSCMLMSSLVYEKCLKCVKAFSSEKKAFDNKHKFGTNYLSRYMRKPTICICENKGADQLRGNREADQRLCFRYRDSTIPLLFKSKLSSLYPASMTVQPGLCRTWSEPKL